MKKVFALLLALTIAFTLAACGDKPASAPSNDTPNPETSQQPGQVDTPDNNTPAGDEWEDYTDYTAGIMKPDFALPAPFELESVGEKYLSFAAAEGTTLDDVKAYTAELENAGFSALVENETAVVYMGRIETADGIIVLSFSYNNGQVKIDVPFHNGQSFHMSEPAGSTSATTTPASGNTEAGNADTAAANDYLKKAGLTFVGIEPESYVHSGFDGHSLTFYYAKDDAPDTGAFFHQVVDACKEQSDDGKLYEYDSVAFKGEGNEAEYTLKPAEDFTPLFTEFTTFGYYKDTTPVTITLTFTVNSDKEQGSGKYPMFIMIVE